MRSVGEPKNRSCSAARTDSTALNSIGSSTPARAIRPGSLAISASWLGQPSKYKTSTLTVSFGQSRLANTRVADELA